MKQNKGPANILDHQNFNGRLQLAQMIDKIKSEIRIVAEKLVTERTNSEQPGVYRRYYSFAVRYLFSKQSNNGHLAHFSFSPNKYNAMQGTGEQPFKMYLNQAGD